MTAHRKQWLATGILALAALVWAFHLGRVNQQGKDQVALANLAARYDSAVVRYGDVDAAAAQLRDSLAYYHATPRVVTRLVQTRDTVRDTVEVFTVDTLAGGPDTTLVTFAPQTQAGVTLDARLRIWPRPLPQTMYRLDYRIGFQPDTLLLALARTPEGLDRIVATAVNTGQALRVLDAVQEPPPRVSPVLQGLRVGSCLLAGFGIGSERWTLAGAGAAGCGLFSLFR